MIFYYKKFFCVKYFFSTTFIFHYVAQAFRY